MLGTHVDDIITGGEGTAYEAAIRTLREKFPFGKWQVGGGSFAGVEYSQNTGSFEIHGEQTKMADAVRPLTRTRRTSTSETLDPIAIKAARSVLGACNYLAGMTRPDLAAQVSLGMQSMPKPNGADAIKVCNLARRTRQFKEVGVTYRHIPEDSIRVVAHVDAGWSNAAGGSSQGGYLLAFTAEELQDGAEAPWSPAVWRSSKLQRKVPSSLAAEAQALNTGLAAQDWLTLLLSEVFDGDFNPRSPEPIFKARRGICITDSKSLFDLTTGVSAPTGVVDKRTSLEVVIARENLDRSQTRLRWAPGELQLADALTKDKAEPTDLLRAVMKTGRFQLREEADFLKQRANERETRTRQKEEQANHNGTNDDGAIETVDAGKAEIAGTDTRDRPQLKTVSSGGPVGTKRDETHDKNPGDSLEDDVKGQ